MAGRGRGKGRGPGRPTVVRRTTRAHPQPEPEVNQNLETETPAHINEQQHAVMAAEVLKIVQDSLPSLLATALGTGAGNGGSTGTRTEGIGPNNGRVIVNNDAPIVGRPAAGGCSYKVFCEGKPQMFEGKRDALATLPWLKEMDAVVKMSECRPDQAVKYVTHSFKGEALYWWDSIQEAYGEQPVDAMTWNGLKELVRSKFCPENELDKMETNFLKLEAGGMTHQEYTTKFDQMARVVPELVSTEERKVKRYLQGLPKVIRKQIKLLAPATYKRAVDLSATAYDEEFGEAGKPDGDKRKWTESNNSGKGGYKGLRKR